MRGVIVRRPDQQDAVVVGRLNWFVPTAFGVMLLEVGWDGLILFWFLPLAILGLLYAIQTRRYRNVARTLFSLAHGFPTSRPSAFEG